MKTRSLLQRLAAIPFERRITLKRMIATVITAATLLLISSTAHAASVDADDRDKDRPSRVIRLVERIHEFTFQDVGTPGPSLGDRLVFTSDLFDQEDRRVGRDGADCVVVRLDLSAPP